MACEQARDAAVAAFERTAKEEVAPAKATGNRGSRRNAGQAVARAFALPLLRSMQVTADGDRAIVRFSP